MVHYINFISFREKEKKMLKADPYAFCSEIRPATASKCHRFTYSWKDKSWMKKRYKKMHFMLPGMCMKSIWVVG